MKNPDTNVFSHAYRAESGTAMIDDPNEAANLVTREVKTSSREGEPTKVVVAHRTYGIGRAALWDLLTNPDKIKEWFLPVSGDLREGGHYQTEGNAGGIIQSCTPNESSTVTWEMDPMTSWLKISLEDDNSDTRLHLAHESPMDPDFWGTYGPGAVGIGWDLALLGLGLRIESGEVVDKADAERFPMTESGRRFVEISAEGWADAAIADGDETDPAQDAAGRSVEFYTEMPAADHPHRA